MSNGDARKLLNPKTPAQLEAASEVLHEIRNNLLAGGHQIKSVRGLLFLVALGGGMLAIFGVLYGLKMIEGTPWQLVGFAFLLMALALHLFRSPYINYGLRASQMRENLVSVSFVVIFSVSYWAGVPEVAVIVLCLWLGGFYAVINTLALFDGPFVDRANILLTTQKVYSKAEFNVMTSYISMT